MGGTGALFPDSVVTMLFSERGGSLGFELHLPPCLNVPCVVGVSGVCSRGDALVLKNVSIFH